MAGKKRKKIKPIGKVPKALKAMADALNVLIAEHNRGELVAGDGLKITPTDNHTRLDLNIDVTGECVEGSSPPQIEITVTSKS